MIHEQIGGHGIPVGDPQDHQKDRRIKHEEDQKGREPYHQNHQDGQQDGKQQGPAHRAGDDAQFHEQHPSGHGEAVDEGAVPHLLPAVDLQGPELIAEAHDGAVQSDEHGQKQGEYPPVGQVVRPQQIGGGGHAGGQEQIDQRDQPERRAGLPHPLPGPGLQLPAVEFHRHSSFSLLF